MPLSRLFSPLAYFGNQENHIEDFLSLLREYRRRRGSPFKVCYDLFAGSGTMTLYLLGEDDFAQAYVVNDVFKPLQCFWEQVRDNPSALVNAYNSLVQQFFSLRETEKNSFYQTLQDKFNSNILLPVDSAANFAFIINHAVDGKPYLNGKSVEQRLCCELNSTSEVLSYDSAFAANVMQVYEILQKRRVTFSSEPFTYYQTQIQSDDFVLLDPPYPNIPDAEERPDHHIYYRSEPKAELQKSLQTGLEQLAEQKTAFLMLYGVLGMLNHHPIVWPQGHVLYLAGHVDHPFQEYIKHLYLSPDLAKMLYEPRFQGKIQPCFIRIFETQAYQGPYKNGDRTAIVWKKQHYTYADINHAANRLANYMLENGLAQQLEENRKADKDTLVVLYLDRGPQLIISILAVMKTGAAYLPLDTGEKRLTVNAAYQRIAQSHANYLLTHPNRLKKLSQVVVDENSVAIDWVAVKTSEVELDDHLFNALTQAWVGQVDKEKNLQHQVQPNDLAYVLYTSGSTGNPKGVEILHRGLPYAFESHQDLLNLNSEDRVAQFASIGFDASLMEIMMALGSGAELHIVPEEAYEDTNLLSFIMRNHQITVIIQTPKMLNALKSTEFPHLRAVLIVGDSFSKSLSDSWLQPIKISGRSEGYKAEVRKVVNGYGLTETTICTTLELCDRAKNLTIGKPILGCEVLLLPLSEEEKNLEQNSVLLSESPTWLVANNQQENTEPKKGAVYVTGPCIARGYWQSLDLTQQRFKETQQHKMYYQTGDIGFYTSEKGEIELRGRIDRQVKIRGQRVELGEIENTLLRIANDTIQEVRMVAHKKKIVRKIRHRNQEIEFNMLAAYIVPLDKNLVISNQLAPTAESINALKDLRKRLLNKVPAFMSPSLANMLFVETLPKKNNDKKSVDDVQIKKQWPTVPCIFLPITAALLSDLTLKQQEQLEVIRQLMAKTIGVKNEDFGIEQNFYDMGGDSLLVKWFMSSLAEHQFSDNTFSLLTKDITIAEFDKNPTAFGIWHEMNYLAQQSLEQKQKLEGYLKDPASPIINKYFVGTHGFEFVSHNRTLNPFMKMQLPLYAFHSLFGNAKLDYTGSKLGELPCYYYCINIPENEKWQTLDELVAIHLRQLEIIHPQNEPYWFIGWSSGGLLAWLVAQKLRDLGKRVFVALLDTAHPQVLCELSAKQHANMLLMITEKIRNIVCEIWECQFDSPAFPSLEALETYNDKIEQTKYMFKALTMALEPAVIHPLSENMTEDEVRDLRRGWHIVRCAEQLLIAELQAGNIGTQLSADDVLIQASENMLDKEPGWQFTIISHLILKETTHFTLLEQPELAKELTEWLKKKLVAVKLDFYQGIESSINDRNVEAISYFNLAIESNPGNSIAYYNCGIIHYRLANIQAALQYFSRAIEHNPQYSNAYERRGFMHAELGEPQKAVDDFSHAIASDPGNEVAHGNRAVAYIELGEVQKALLDFNEAIKLNSEYVLAYVNRGSLYFPYLNNPSAAQDDYNRAIELDREHAEAYFNRATLYTELGKFQAALADYTSILNFNSQDARAYGNRGVIHAAIGNIEEALADFNAAIKIDPQYITAYANRARFYFEKRGNKKKALKDYNTALTLDPENADIYYNLGIIYANLGEPEKALWNYNQSIALDRHSVGTYENRCIVYRKLGEFQKALDDLNRVISFNPQYAQAYVNRGNSHAELSQFYEAMKDYNHAIALEPQSANAFYNRGITYNKMNFLIDALQDLNTAIALDLWAAKPFYTRGQLYAKLGQTEDALRDYTRAIELDSQYTDAYYNRGIIYDVRLGQVQLALNDYNHAIILNPEHAWALYYRGLLYAELDQTENALRDYNQAIALNLQHANVYYHRGVIYTKLNRLDEALEDYNNAIRLNPQEAQAYINRGIIYAELGRLDKALEDHNHAVSVDPQSAKAFYNRAITYYKLNRKKRTLQDFTAAIKLNPQYAQAFYFRAKLYEDLGYMREALQDYSSAGDIHVELGQFHEALQDYSFAIEINPQSLQLYYNRGIIYDKINYKEEALQDLSVVIALNPQFDQAYCHRGKIYAELGRFHQALKDFDNAIKLNPWNAPAYGNRGNIHAELGYIYKALRDYSDAINLDPKYVSAYYNRAITYDKINYMVDALQDFSEVVSLDPQYAEAYYYRGQIYALLGDIQAARKDFKRLVELDPQSKSIYFDAAVFSPTHCLIDENLFEENVVISTPKLAEPDYQVSSANKIIMPWFSVLYQFKIKIDKKFNPQLSIADHIFNSWTLLINSFILNTLQFSEINERSEAKSIFITETVLEVLKSITKTLFGVPNSTLAEHAAVINSRSGENLTEKEQLEMYVNHALSFQDKLTSGRYLFHYIRKYSPYTLPSNRQHNLSNEEKTALKQMQKEIRIHEKNIAAQKISRIGQVKLFDDKFAIVDNLLIKAKQEIGKSLKHKQITTAVLSDIRNKIDRVKEIIHTLAKQNKTLKRFVVKENRLQRRNEKTGKQMVAITQHNLVSGKLTQEIKALSDFNQANINPGIKVFFKQSTVPFSSAQQFWDQPDPMIQASDKLVTEANINTLPKISK